jgi:hypothetical protein
MSLSKRICGFLSNSFPGKIRQKNHPARLMAHSETGEFTAFLSGDCQSLLTSAAAKKSARTE